MKAIRSCVLYILFISVSIQPQAMAFTLMLEGPSSFASAFVNPFKPLFAAEYATSHEAPMFPHIDEILMMDPDCRLTICGIHR